MGAECCSMMKGGGRRGGRTAHGPHGAALMLRPAAASPTVVPPLPTSPFVPLLDRQRPCAPAGRSWIQVPTVSRAAAQAAATALSTAPLLYKGVRGGGRLDPHEQQGEAAPDLARRTGAALVCRPWLPPAPQGHGSRRAVSCQTSRRRRRRRRRSQAPPASRTQRSNHPSSAPPPQLSRSSGMAPAGQYKVQEAASGRAMCQVRCGD